MEVEREYQRDPKLKKGDVQKLMDWLTSQPHLPQISEHEVIWFLNSCYYSNEAAKTTIDNYYTMKTMSPEVFCNRNPTSPSIQKALSVILFTVLPRRTPDGCAILFGRFIDPNPDHFDFNQTIKQWDMVTTLDLHQNGTSDGYRMVFDMQEVVFGHVTKLGLLTMKKFLMYLQEAMPVKLKGLHYVNVVPFMDKILALMKPFMKKELMDMLHLHPTVNEFTKFVPLECLPSDYGGSVDSIAVLKDKTLKNIQQNVDFFLRQDKQLVDESKRPGKPKSVSDVYGVEGTFKKLEMD